MVTGKADREGVESRKTVVGTGRWFRVTSRREPLVRHRRVQRATPGSEAASSFT
jgi:hypothetical protein